MTKDTSFRAEMGPGSVVVVGPRGRILIDTSTNETIFRNCDFIHPDAMSPVHRALVNERWDEWDDLGLERVKDNGDNGR